MIYAAKKTLIMMFIATSFLFYRPTPALPFTKQQVWTANFIMSQAKKLAKISVEGNIILVLNFKLYLYPKDINKRLIFVRAVANADAILSGRSRSIYFYDPSGNEFARADILNGIRLTN